jgi:hypothetical protein
MIYLKKNEKNKFLGHNIRLFNFIFFFCEEFK